MLQCQSHLFRKFDAFGAGQTDYSGMFRAVFTFVLVFKVITIATKARKNGVIIKSPKKNIKSVDIVFEVVYTMRGSGNPSCSTRVPLVVTRASTSNHYIF